MKRLVFLLSISSIVSCSGTKTNKENVDEVFGTKDYADGLVSTIEPLWFTGSKNYRLTRSDGQSSIHLLFDSKSGIDLATNTLNFIVKTPVKSPVQYEVNLASGQRYVSKRFCSQEDVWEQYDKKLSLPNFTFGIIPRIMDQLGMPQEIIVFGGQDYIQSNFQNNYFDARVVGGVIEQVCPRGGCLKLGDWKSRIKLIGVLKGDSRFDGIEKLDELKSLVKWDYAKAFIENGQGKNIVANNTYPAIRIGASLTAKQALRYIDKNSIQLSNKKLFSMRKSCQKLYNHIWDDFGAHSSFEKEALKFKKSGTRAAFLSKNRAKHKDLFYKKFIKYFRKYHTDYMTCSKYMYSSNVNEDRKRHWFFAYLTSLHNIIDLGYTYDCSRTAWSENPVTANGEKMIPLRKSFVGCDSRSIDFAFEYAPSYLADLRGKNYESYRYVDYDRGRYGTHEKIYSWVKTDPRVFQCIDETNSQIVKETFPSDIKWKRRSLKVKMKNGEYL